MSNYGSSIWAAACPRTSLPAPRVLARLPHAVDALGAANTADAAYLALGRTPVETGRVRPTGVDKPAERRVFAKSAAVQVDVQVQDTGIRMSLGPPPWSPPE